MEYNKCANVQMCEWEIQSEMCGCANGKCEENVRMSKCANEKCKVNERMRKCANVRIGNAR